MEPVTVEARARGIALPDYGFLEHDEDSHRIYHALLNAHVDLDSGAAAVALHAFCFKKFKFASHEPVSLLG